MVLKYYKDKKYVFLNENLFNNTGTSGMGMIVFLGYFIVGCDWMVLLEIVKVCE